MPAVAPFLIQRMNNAGVNHVFGVPGDYLLNFYKKLEDFDGIDLISCTDENHAGFAADAYSRVAGIGCVAVTYNVGALKIANAVACAYAERSPLVIISGSPGLKEREEGILLHHMVRSFDCQREVFENITCASAVLDNPNRAGYEIDRVFEALNFYKQPIYIELPRDVAERPISYDAYKQGTPVSPQSDPDNLDEAIAEVEEWIKSSESPVILAGVQLARFGLGNELVKFAERLKIPITTTLLSKSVVDESHSLFRGVYSGSASQEPVRNLVENSDCLLMFGALLTDMTTNFKPSKFEKRQTVSCSIEGLKVKNHSYEDVQFVDFCDRLFNTKLQGVAVSADAPKKKPKQWDLNKGEVITSARLFEKIDSILDDSMAIVADIGDSLFGASDLLVHSKNHFLSPAFYTSMGFAIPGALGVQTAKPDVRPIVLVGDGAFQMSCTELSTIVRRGLNPIVFVLDNKGYLTERFLLEGDYNNVANWDYHEIPKMIGGGIGVCVNTEGELEEAVDNALANKELNIISVSLAQNDASPGLERLIEGLAKKIK